MPAPTIHCALRPPGVTGQLPVPGIVAFGDSADFIVNGRKYAEAHYTWYPNNPANPGGPGRQRIVVSVNPTTADWPGQPIAPSGDWGVEIIGATVPVDIRVQRDDSLAGYRQRGRQSYLVDSTYADYDAAGRPFLLDNVAGLVTRTGTVNQLFTARLPNIHVISAHARLGSVAGRADHAWRRGDGLLGRRGARPRQHRRARDCRRDARASRDRHGGNPGRLRGHRLGNEHCRALGHP